MLHQPAIEYKVWCMASKHRNIALLNARFYVCHGITVAPLANNLHVTKDTEQRKAEFWEREQETIKNGMVGNSQVHSQLIQLKKTTEKQNKTHTQNIKASVLAVFSMLSNKWPQSNLYASLFHRVMISCWTSTRIPDLKAVF